MSFSLIDFLQALTAGILVGSAYALMCVGLGIIFGAMRVVNFAQGDFLMLGMYAAFYLTTGYGVLAFLGPYGGPIVAAFLAGPIVFAVGWLVHRFMDPTGRSPSPWSWMGRIRKTERLCRFICQRQWDSR